MKLAATAPIVTPIKIPRISPNLNFLDIRFLLECKLYQLQTQYLQYLIRMRSLSTVEMLDKDEIIWNTQANLDQHLKSPHKIDISKVFKASNYFSKTQTVMQTPFTQVDILSELFDCKVYLKREDQQLSKTFKIRGAYFKSKHDKQKNIPTEYVTASDGNFACSCACLASLYKVKYHIFVPLSCFSHKLDFIKNTGGQFVQLHQVGSDYESTVKQARDFAASNNLKFLHPFQNYSLMAGYATVAKQMFEQQKEVNFDFVIVPTGGGGLVSSIASFFKQTNPETKVISVETDIATPFSTSIKSGKLIPSEKASKFCNGSSVRETNEIITQIAKNSVDGFVTVSEGIVAQMVIKLYSIGIISEPSGALGLAGLTKMRQLIKGKNVAVVLTGANIDLTQLNQARDMNLISKGYKNCYIIELPNKKNVIYELITKCFKQTDIITVQYSKKTSKQTSQALLSVESLSQDDVEESIDKLREGKYTFEIINEKEQLLDIFF